MSCFCQVDFTDIEFYEKCGSGTSGCVYRALWKSQNRIVAVKKVLAFNTEADVLNNLSHRNIIQFFGIVNEPPNFCLLTEYADLGSLFDYLHLPESADLNFEQTVKWAKDIGLGMNYLHVEAPVKFLHRDLKSKNVVIDNNFTCKICDFGASRFHESTTIMSVQGTYPWMAPEMIQRHPISEACDVWSYGVVLWELLTHEIPFEGLNAYRIMWLVVEDGQRLTIPSSCPEKFCKILEKCWHTEPKDRPHFREILLLLDNMQNDGDLQTETDSCFGDRSGWKSEIEASIERIKKMERNLETWEQQLRDREIWVKEKEKKLEQHISVVEVLSHDVNSWRDIDVQQWIIQLSLEGHRNRDLGQYAELFVLHDINGNRLLRLNRDNLWDMGIKSVGHVKELLEAIEELNAHNSRLLNFPPLNATLQAKHVSETFTRSVVLIIGCHLRLGLSVEEIKWKIYLEVDADDDDDNGGSDHNIPVTSLIKQVLFTSPQLPSNSVRITQSPYIMDKWVVSKNIQNISIRCVVEYEDVVRRPRNSKVDFAVNLSDTVACSAPLQTCVTLAVAHQSSTPSKGATCRPRMFHSESTPALQNVWSLRNMEASIPHLDTRHYQEHKWTGVVTQCEKPEFPAYNPRFPPAVPLMFPAEATGDVVWNRANASFTSSSTSSVHSRESVALDRDVDPVNSVFTPGIRQCRTEADLMRGISREISNDSGGVFLSPSPGVYVSSIPPQLNTGLLARKSGVPTMAEISRRLLAYDSPSTDTSQQASTTTENSAKPHRPSSPRRLSSPMNEELFDFEPSVHVRSNSLRLSGHNGVWSGPSRCVLGASGSGLLTVAQQRNLQKNADEADNCVQTPQTEFSFGIATSQRKFKKGKSKKPNSQTDLKTGAMSVKSYEVHGGNAKWTWK